MTKMINLAGNFSVVFSDECTPFLKKPTISVMQGNVFTKIASFNNQERFEWFVKLLDSVCGVKEDGCN